MSKPRPNAISSTPNRNSKPKGKLNNTAKATVKAAATKREHAFSYLCTVCETTVFKNPVHTAKEGDKSAKSYGLGKWRCSCGNKKVKRVKFAPKTEEKAAA